MTSFSSLVAFSIIALVCSSDYVYPDDQNRSDGSGTPADPYIIPLSTVPIKIDGDLDEEAWSKALSIPLAYEYWPGNNIPAPVKTEFLVTYDRSHVYFGFRCYDPDPSSICAHFIKRDKIWYDDWVRIYVETFNDGRRAYIFGCNPMGIQGDGTWASANPGLDWSWDGIWDSASRINDWGYSVEMAIPFNQLYFQRTDSEQVWAMTAERCYPRVAWRVMGMFAWEERNLSRWLFQLPKFKGFSGSSPGCNIEINPTITAVRTDGRDNMPSGKLETLDRRADLGLTSRWGITPNISVSGTLNPDFSQVEADALQLDINEPFALSYPEKRSFFTEGADYFLSRVQVVYTRTLRDPSWGVKLAGKEGSNTIGVYAVRDEITNLIFPGSRSSSSTSLPMANTSSVFRYKRDIGINKTVGFIATDREGEDYFNRVFGVDGLFHLSETDLISFELMGSTSLYPEAISVKFEQPEGDFSDRALYFNYVHQTRSFLFGTSYMDIGPLFRADIGFIPQVDFRRLHVLSTYEWIPEEDSWHWGMELTGDYEQLYDHDGNLIIRKGFSEFIFNGRRHIEAIVKYTRAREFYNNVNFDQNDFQIDVQFKPAVDHTVGIVANFGDRVDYANTRLGKRVRLSPFVSSYIGRHLRLDLNHTFERLTVDEGRLYSANISQLSANYQFSPRAFLRSILQYIDYRRDSDLYGSEIDPEFKRFFAQLLFSYQLNPRTVLYLGYSDNYFGSHEFGLTRKDRTFFLKLGYAWIM